MSAASTPARPACRATASLPAYLMTSGSNMELVEQHRGMASSPAQLSLQRQLWLDFDGGGYTLQDQLTGTLAQESRLEALPDIRLGRVSLNGEPQLITRQADGQAEGVEVRSRSLNLEADSRYEASNGIPVSGWQQELQQVTTTFHLPPGWLLLAAWGTDNLAATWLQQWNLLDLFLVLLIVVASGYLYGWQWGAVAGIALLLTWHLPAAPKIHLAQPAGGDCPVACVADCECKFADMAGTLPLAEPAGAGADGVAVYH